MKNLAIITYLRKKVLKQQGFIERIQKIPFEGASVAAFSGKTLWKDDNLRLDYSLNAENPDEIFINLQKNKSSKLDGLKGFNTDDKLVTYAIKTGVPITAEEVEEKLVDLYY